MESWFSKFKSNKLISIATYLIALNPTKKDLFLTGENIDKIKSSTHKILLKRNHLNVNYDAISTDGLLLCCHIKKKNFSQLIAMMFIEKIDEKPLS